MLVVRCHKKELIGKSLKPQCLKNIKKLPVKYAGNKRSWMLSDLFEREIRHWDDELNTNARNIELLLDNCIAHPHSQELKSIRLVSLP